MRVPGKLAYGSRTCVYTYISRCFFLESRLQLLLCSEWTFFCLSDLLFFVLFDGLGCYVLTLINSQTKRFLIFFFFGAARVSTVSEYDSDMDLCTACIYLPFNHGFRCFFQNLTSLVVIHAFSENSKSDDYYTE
jgi:hypothetical protein